MEEITLKKANSISKEMISQALDTKIETTVDAYLYPNNWKNKLNQFDNEFDLAMRGHIEKLEVGYQMRVLVRKGNEDSGVNAILDKLSKLQAEMKINQQVLRVTEQPLESAVVSRKIEILSKNGSDDRWGRDSVDVGSSFIKESLERRIEEIKKEIKREEDRLGTINHTVKVQIDDNLYHRLIKIGVDI